MEQTGKSRNKPLHLKNQLVFDKGAKFIQCGKNGINGMGQLDSYVLRE